MKATFAYLHFKTLDSTHLWCKRELATVAKFLSQASCLLITCDEQTAGIGRSGSTWKAAKQHLALQLCFPYPNLHAASLSLTISHALSTLLQKKGVPAKLKWPNDIWTSRGKIAGLILENVSYNEDFICLVGIGLNISDPSESDEAERQSIDQPVDFANRYFADTPSAQTLAIEISCEILKAIEAQKISPLSMDDFMRDSWTCPGAFIEVNLNGSRIEGVILGFEPQGDLVLKTSCGEEKKLRSGICRRVRVIQKPQIDFTNPLNSNICIQTATCQNSSRLRRT